MEDLVTEASPGKAATPPPPRRSVRRRLVQSTLFPHKPPEHNAKDNDDKGNENDDEYCPSSKKKKRKPNPKPKPKLTPPEKPSKNSTPKKNASANGNKRSTSKQVFTDSDEVATHVPDLRLEAKISAEENARLFAGRQIHPFFSSWKALKKSQEQAEIGNKFCAHKKDNEAITCGPIHVFENVQEDTLCLDWRNWTFLGKDTYVNYAPESYDDKTLSALDTSGVSISHNALTLSDRLSIQPENVQATSLSENLAVPANEQTILPQMLKDAEVDLKVDESVTFSGQAHIFRKSYADPLSRFLQESMKSYYHNCKDKADNSLWTYKYKPAKATEVCGNDESVNILRDWLQQWHERRYQGRKNSSNRDKWDMQDGDDDDGDYNCSLSDYDSEDLTEEDSLHNVLLITGPIGSGKSAAVYACAQEQGFEIFELNASDCRNGPAVKQYFGDTLGSLGFKRLPEDIESSQKKTMKLSPAMALPKDKTADEMDDGMVEPITISDDEACGPAGTSQKLPCKNSVLTCHKVQTLILVEEVDILFPEDRGCIAAIQQIAETARGPIILISNSDDPRLPDNFDRLNLSFSLPSPKELFCHLYKVCVSEGVNIHPLLLEKFIQSCNGDIRKTIMNLQFWFQSMQFGKDGKAQTGYGSLPFDLGLGHQILPKLIPWDFPSELSELVEKELANSISITEENSRLQGMQNDLDAHDMETDYREAKKLEMIKRNETTADYTELEIQYNISEFSDSFGSPQALPTQNDGRRKLIVMSSDSEDEDPNNVHLQCTHDEADKSQSLNDNNESPSKFQLNEHHSGTSFRKLVCSELEDQEEEFFRFSETANTCESLDISCVPESTYVPETAIENEIETMSGAVSSGHPAVPPEISVNNELKPLGVRRRLVKFPENPCLLVNNGFPESPSKEAVQDLYNENPKTAIVHVMDECSRVDFQLKSKFVESTPMIETDTVQKWWRNLREGQTDLGRHATSEQLGTFEVVKLVSELSNLISEADLFFDHRGQCDVMEPAMSLSGEATASWYDEEIMMSTVAVSGFCFYVNRIADEGSKLGFENKVDLTSEMLASTTNIMTLGKLSRADLTKSTDIYTGKESELDNPVYDVHKSLLCSENNTSLFNIIQSIVPARISLVLKGVAFNEYLSSMRQISRSEDFRVSQGVKRRGRVRGSQHYLSKCTMLSPEDISLVSERDFCKKISSQCTANEENKHT
ncbi:uncharacterized protein LOC130943949 isoform X1 [Arachis stenosperma]|uniref:uncharacterized protein LOC130943949 isoform X1 n=1 Tax=Arachis stenosperma TaxID=217475 RepID=UPI0025AD4E4A|nr:uncharacterized protein LOC130943949 isoform X1 [Arachis stenosperma]